MIESIRSTEIKERFHKFSAEYTAFQDYLVAEYHYLNEYFEKIHGKTFVETGGLDNREKIGDFVARMCAVIGTLEEMHSTIDQNLERYKQMNELFLEPLIGPEKLKQIKKMNLSGLPVKKGLFSSFNF